MRFEQRTCDLCGYVSDKARRGSPDENDRQRFHVVFGGWQVSDEGGRIKDICPTCAWARDEKTESTHA